MGGVTAGMDFFLKNTLTNMEEFQILEGDVVRLHPVAVKTRVVRNGIPIVFDYAFGHYRGCMFRVVGIDFELRCVTRLELLEGDVIGVLFPFEWFEVISCSWDRLLAWINLGKGE